MTSGVAPLELIACLTKSDTVVEGRATVLSGPQHDDWAAYAALLKFDFNNPSLNSVLAMDTAWPILTPEGVRMFVPRLVLSSIRYPEFYKTSNFFGDFVWSLSRDSAEFISKERKRYALFEHDLLNCLEHWTEWLLHSQYCLENHITKRQIRNLAVNLSLLRDGQLGN